MVKCLQGGGICPAPEALEKIIRACKEKQLDYEIYEKEGCKQVKCKEPETMKTVECKKFIKGNCIIISCTDGYVFNSCKTENICPIVECEKFKDDKGCIVKRCSNGYEAIDCPKAPKIEECKVYTRDDGCQVKKCTDGKEYVSCPEVQCKEYKDEKGCKIKECLDGSKEKVCPDQSMNIECKVYTYSAKDRTCTVKECSNGYRYDSCEKIKVKCKERKEGDCIIKECEDGSVSKDCQKGEDVECKVYQTPDNCKMKVCTNGYEEKVCPETQRPELVKPRGIIERIKGFFQGLFK